ncbi:ATP-binding protein [Paenibacillus gansuensis]|uniref:histidine kinase n=1 Tax=Paenibacillus gansuensis TaxID=306542 RepID=A0ABW5PIF7_9BACL
MTESTADEIRLPMNAIEFFASRLSGGAILVVDMQDRIRYTSEPLCHMLSIGEYELQGRPVSDILPEGCRLQDIYEQYFKAGNERTEAKEIWVGLKDGVRHKVELNMFRVLTENEPLYVMSMQETKTKPELMLQQHFSGTFMKTVNLGILLFDMDFRVLDISDMACNILGVRREELIHQSMEEVFASVPVSHQLVQRSLLDGMIVRNHAISWMNNEERYELLMDSNLLKDEKGTIVGAYVIFKDVSNLRSLEQQVQRSDRLAMIGQIAAGTAHEIRNPLTSIKGFLQMFKKTLLEKQMDKEYSYTEIMLSEIDRINELVSEFLLLSKPKNISFDLVDVSTVLREILPIINNEAILHSVTVQFQASFELPKIVGNRELLKQVFLNICKNGIEAMSSGGTLCITERVDNDHGNRRVNIDIHDTGPGIPAFLVDKIFDPFFTTKQNGTGLGLSVCQRIIHDIGGHIRVSSKGYGTTFTVSIPYNEQ